MKNGELIEMGNHEELHEKYPDGTYAGFCKKQDATQGPSDNTSPEKKKETTDMKKKEGDLDENEEEKMKKLIDEKDKKYKLEADNHAEKCAETGGFMKLIPYNNPKWLILSGSLGAAALGGSMAYLGLAFSEYLSLLVPPIEAWKLIKGEEIGATYFHDTNIYWALILTGLAFVSGIGAFWQQYSFHRLGAGATLKVRELLYEKILQKDIGWFDERDNASGVLTNTMAQDTSIINGVSSESLGPIFEAAFALLGGVIIAFIFCWQEALICLVLSPFMIVGSAIAMEL